MTLTTLVAVAALNAPLFFNIAPFSDGNEKTVATDMKEYVARTGNRTVLYSLTLHPEGKPAMAKVDRALASYRRLKEELKGSDVELGILLQAIVGHWPRTDKEIEPWQRTVNANGREVRFCALDEGYRSYIRTVAKLLAAEKPCFILGDDDIRAFSPSAECFCPLHVAAFNRRRGTNYTSEQLRAAVKQAGPGDPDFETFMTLQRELVNGICALIREGIDEVDPTIPAGTCMPGWCFRFNDQAARAIAAKGQRTVMRFANGNYQERSYGTTDFIGIVQRTQSYFAYHHDKVDDILSEADTYPHHLWSRASTSWHAHLTMTFFTGLKGAKLWFVNAHKGKDAVNRNYTDMLAANRGFYPELVRTMAGARPVGLIEPCLTRFPNWHPMTNTTESFVSTSTWARVVFGRMGVPFTFSRDYSQGGVWTLAGSEAIDRLTDGDLRQILSHSVLVDGDAAVALTRRGLADLVGATAVRTNTLFNCEIDAENGQTYRLTKSDDTPTLTALAGAKILTHLGYSPYSGAKEIERVAPATTVFQNRLGGRVAASSYYLGVSGDQICNERRKAWLEKVIDELTGGPQIPYVENPQDIMSLAALAADGATLLAVFNLNYDPMKTIDLRLGRAMASVEALQGDGSWKRLAVQTLPAGVVRIPYDVPCYGTVVLRVRAY